MVINYWDPMDVVQTSHTNSLVGSIDACIYGGRPWGTGLSSKTSYKNQYALDQWLLRCVLIIAVYFLRHTATETRGAPASLLVDASVIGPIFESKQQK